MTARVVVNPNNPDGRVWTAPQAVAGLAPEGLLVIDESFADTCPEVSLIGLAMRPGTILLKSFGKFWGLAGLRLGFAIGDAGLIARLSGMLGPWPVSGPALAIGAAALADLGWTGDTRARLARDPVVATVVVNRQAGARVAVDHRHVGQAANGVGGQAGAGQCNTCSRKCVEEKRRFHGWLQKKGWEKSLEPG